MKAWLLCTILLPYFSLLKENSALDFQIRIEKFFFKMKRKKKENSAPTKHSICLGMWLNLFAQDFSKNFAEDLVWKLTNVKINIDSGNSEGTRNVK